MPVLMMLLLMRVSDEFKKKHFNLIKKEAIVEDSFFFILNETNYLTNNCFEKKPFLETAFTK